MSENHTHSKLYWAPCGKTRYPDKRAALGELNSFRKHRGRHGRPEALRAYPCPDCAGWHLTKILHPDRANKNRKGKP